MRNKKITVTVIGVTVTVLFTLVVCSCTSDVSRADRLMEPDEETTKESASSEEISEDVKMVLGASKKKNDDSADGEASGDITAEDINEPITPVSIDIKKIEMSEAILIDDVKEDLLKSADGTEIDYRGMAGSEKLPVFYTSDQVDNNDYITPVRNQGYTALCWNFAALGAVESNLLKHHDNLSADTLNLSEKHGAYYNMHQAIGSTNGGIDNDYREFVFVEDDEFLSDYDTGYLSVGGVTDYCLSLLTAWKGPVLDEDSDSIHVVKGQNEIYTQNADKPSDPYEGTYCHVQNVLEVPATAKNRDVIKRLIMEHGSVTASICADDEFWTGKKVALYDYKKCGNGNYADHEILIVGWNDEYPADNFVTKPDTDGAFICRNSWGEKHGASGYFYLSYEDSILCNNIVAAYDCAMPGDNNWYDKNYQYAGFLTHIKDPIIDQRNVVYMFDKNNASYGILFSPEEDEKLSAVGYFSMSTKVSDEVTIYELPSEDKSNPEEYFDLHNQGKILITMDCKSITGGYHTFPVKDSVEVKKGQTYLVKITPGKEQYLVYEKAQDYTTHVHKDEWQQTLGAIHTHSTASGHSYLQDNTGKFMIRQDNKDFFVKAYTNRKSE